MTKRNPSEKELLEIEGIEFVQLKDLPAGTSRQHITFTREAIGAIPNGTRIAKTNSNPPDANQDGALGTVEGSIGPVPEGELKGQYGYFVRWDSWKEVQVFITGNRIEAVTQ